MVNNNTILVPRPRNMQERKNGKKKNIQKEMGGCIIMNFISNN